MTQIICKLEVSPSVTRAHVRAHTNTHTHTYTHTPNHTHARTRTKSPTQTHSHTHAHTHTRTHTHTHTHFYTQNGTGFSRCSSAFLSQLHSTIAQYSFVHPPLTFYDISEEAMLGNSLLSLSLSLHSEVLHER